MAKTAARLPKVRPMMAKRRSGERILVGEVSSDTSATTEKPTKSCVAVPANSHAHSARCSWPLSRIDIAGRHRAVGVIEQAPQPHIEHRGGSDTNALGAGQEGQTPVELAARSGSAALALATSRMQ